MSNPLTEARQAVVTALAPLGVTIYGAPPETVTPPAALIMAGEPWSAPLTYGSTRVNLVVTLMATMSGSNEAAMERLEALAWSARMALQDVALLGEAPAPRLVKVGVAEVAAADLSLSVTVTDT
jgi:hypothetical protein